jgi:hypothetical protein
MERADFVTSNHGATIMAMTEHLDFDELDRLLQDVKGIAQSAVNSGTAMHIVERKLLDKLLQMGHAAIGAMFQSVGNGDVGETYSVPERMEPLNRYPKLSSRTYRSIFGDFELSRYLYGDAPKTKALAIPLDEHFGLPSSRFSLLLESWVSQLSTSEPIHEAMDKLYNILGIRIGVDSAERIIARTGNNAEWFQDNLPAVEVAAEGELLVESTDNKGIVMRHKRAVEKLPVGAPANRVGPKPDQKQMATLSGCYSVDRHIRTPRQVLDALFRVETLETFSAPRPRPQQSRFQACLSRSQDHPEDYLDGEVSAIGWLSELVAERRRETQELINLNDGELSIWSNIEHLQGQNGRVDILDLIHAIQRVWDAAALLKPKDVTAFAKEHILSILNGNVKRVIQSLRWQTTHLGLKDKPLRDMQRICTFLERNAGNMKYNEYLAQGYPIATGFIEGACRHLIKDRMERSGMRWSVQGAQHMLYLRCVDAAGLWKDFNEIHQNKTLAIYGIRKNFRDSFQLAA